MIFIAFLLSSALIGFYALSIYQEKKYGSSRKKIVFLHVFFILIIVSANLFLFFMQRNQEKFLQKNEEIFNEYYSTIEFEGKIIARHKIYDCGFRNITLVCVELEESNTSEFYRYDKKMGGMRIHDGIATFPCDKSISLSENISYVSLNKNGNKLMIFKTEDGFEQAYPYDLIFTCLFKELYLRMCN